MEKMNKSRIDQRSHIEEKQNVFLNTFLKRRFLFSCIHFPHSHSYQMNTSTLVDTQAHWFTITRYIYIRQALQHFKKYDQLKFILLLNWIVRKAKKKKKRLLGVYCVDVYVQPNGSVKILLLNIYLSWERNSFKNKYGVAQASGQNFKFIVTIDMLHSTVYKETLKK